MLDLMCNGMEIKINLSNGIYQAEPVSSSGKSYLYTMLQELGRDDILALSYKDMKFLVNEAAINEIFSQNYKLILVDRYDLCEGVLDNYLQRYENTAIVIIDLKQKSESWIEHMCEFDLTECRLEVNELW